MGEVPPFPGAGAGVLGMKVLPLFAPLVVLWGHQMGRWHLSWCREGWVIRHADGITVKVEAMWLPL